MLIMSNPIIHIDDLKILYFSFFIVRIFKNTP